MTKEQQIPAAVLRRDDEGGPLPQMVAQHREQLRQEREATPSSNERATFIELLNLAEHFLAERQSEADETALRKRIAEALTKAPPDETSAPLTHSPEPSAYLKLWDQNGPRCRVDLTPINEPWLEYLKPIVTPLYARMPSVEPSYKSQLPPTSLRLPMPPVKPPREPDLTCDGFVPDPHSSFCDKCGYPEREHRRTVNGD